MMEARARAINKYRDAEDCFFEDVPCLFPTKESLIEFWEDVKDLTFPGYYGSNPWPAATFIAFYVFSGYRTHKFEEVQKILDFYFSEN